MPTRTSIVPRAVAGFNVAHISPSSHVFLNMVDQGGINKGGVRVEVALLEAIHEDTRRGRCDFEMRVGDTVLFQRNKYIASYFVFFGFFAQGNFTQERAPGVGDADQEEGNR